MIPTGHSPEARFDGYDGTGRSWRLDGLVEVIDAHHLNEVVPALRAVEAAVARGHHAAGFLAYEAAPALDASLTCHPPRHDLPLLWFGIFRDRHEVSPLLPPDDPTRGTASPWAASLSRSIHAARIAAIRSLIAAGDTYQVNLTFPLHADITGTDADLYAHLGRSQGARYCALLRLPRVSIVSASPELFFRWSGDELELRPMKGTRPRGRWPGEDQARADELPASEKERAENLMIVDLLRNDAGRIAEFGSVRVDRLFEIESYPTVHQMTSSIRATTRPGTTLTDLLRALFPCGSVTGAPKVRTMQIIADLEDGPRGVYTGAVGLVSRDEAVFNVPIRTVIMDRSSGHAEMGVGSGVTYGSDADREYDECLQKAAFTHHRMPAFALLETLRFDPGKGFHLLDGHLDRLAASAAYFRYPFVRAEAIGALVEGVPASEAPLRVRLLLSSDGELRVETFPLGVMPPSLRACVAPIPVDSADPLLFHKTTHREPYDSRLAACPGFDEVLLHNERGELTEFANGNLVLRIDGVDWTPPLPSGLLPGVMRGALLGSGRLTERVMRVEDLRGATAIFRINSVRGWTPVELSDAADRIGGVAADRAG